MPVNFYGMSVYRKFYLAVICVFVACSLLVYPAAAQSTNLQDCVTSYNASTDYFPIKTSVEDATSFFVQYHNNYKLVTNKNTNETFALTQCGTPRPTNLANGTKFFDVPVRHVAVLGTPDVAFLELLGVRSSITELDSSVATTVSSSCIQKLLNASTVSVISQNLTLASQQESQVDVIFGAFVADPTQNKSVSVSATSDPGALNRAEWLKFYATFYNLEDRAKAVSDGIFNGYTCLKNATTAVVANTRPVVAWATYEAPADFNNNTASWSISVAAYKAQLTTDAGGSIFNASVLSYSTSASFLQAVANVDILIDETYIANNLTDVYSNYGISSSAVANLKFAAGGKIFREDGVQSKAGGIDWFESAVVQADAVLADLINVINPGYPTASYQRVWFRNVTAGEVPKLSDPEKCDNTTAIRVDSAPTCNGAFPAAQHPTSGAGSLGTKGVLVALAATLAAIACAAF